MDVIALIKQPLLELDMPSRTFSSAREGTLLITETLKDVCISNHLTFFQEVRAEGFKRADGKGKGGIFDFSIDHNDQIFAIEIDRSNKKNSLDKLIYLADVKKCTPVWIRWKYSIRIEIPTHINLIDLT